MTCDLTATECDFIRGVFGPPSNGKRKHRHDEVPDSPFYVFRFELLQSADSDAMRALLKFLFPIAEEAIGLPMDLYDLMPSDALLHDYAEELGRTVIRTAFTMHVGVDIGARMAEQGGFLNGAFVIGCYRELCREGAALRSNRTAILKKLHSSGFPPEFFDLLLSRAHEQNGTDMLVALGEAQVVDPDSDLAYQSYDTAMTWHSDHNVEFPDRERLAYCPILFSHEYFMKEAFESNREKLLITVFGVRFHRHALQAQLGRDAVRVREWYEMAVSAHMAELIKLFFDCYGPSHFEGVSVCWMLFGANKKYEWFNTVTMLIENGIDVDYAPFIEMNAPSSFFEDLYCPYDETAPSYRVAAPGTVERDVTTRPQIFALALFGSQHSMTRRSFNRMCGRFAEDGLSVLLATACRFVPFECLPASPIDRECSELAWRNAVALSYSSTTAVGDVYDMRDLNDAVIALWKRYRHEISEKHFALVALDLPVLVVCEIFKWHEPTLLTTLLAFDRRWRLHKLIKERHDTKIIQQQQ